MEPAGVLAPREEEVGRLAALQDSSGAQPGLMAGPGFPDGSLGWQGRGSCGAEGGDGSDSIRDSSCPAPVYFSSSYVINCPFGNWAGAVAGCGCH